MRCKSDILRTSVKHGENARCGTYLYVTALTPTGNSRIIYTYPMHCKVNRRRQAGMKKRGEQIPG